MLTSAKPLVKQVGESTGTHILNQIEKTPNPTIYKPINCLPLNSPAIIPHNSLSLEQNVLLFPRCEYFQQYAATSHFDMQAPQHYATYFRSTGRGGGSARFTQTEIADKTFVNTQINVPKAGKKTSNYHGRTGTFHSPLRFDNYQQAFEEAARALPASEIKYDSDLATAQLHDDILRYKNDCCALVVEGFARTYPSLNKKIVVYHHNDFPCIMVSLTCSAKFNHQEAWNSLFIAYLSAIANKTAEDQGVPIEMVHRSGFGYHLPTVDITGACFRINMGVVPRVYIMILVQSLGKLVYTIETVLLKKPADFDQNGENILVKMNQEIQQYKEPLPKWQEKHTFADVLQLAGDTQNQAIIVQITRMRQYIDLCAQYVLQELHKERPDLAIPIIEMLLLLNFNKQKNNTSVVTMNVHPDMFKVAARQWPTPEHRAIETDDYFWNMIEQIFLSVDAKPDIPEDKRLLGLYSRLEKANKEFVIRATTNQEVEAETDVGSTSEEEESYGEHAIYSAKLTVATGMMAINLAYYLARFFVKQDTKNSEFRTNSDYMYYEVKDLFALSTQSGNDLATRTQRKTSIPVMPLFDLNHCDTTTQDKISLEAFLAQQDPQKILPVIILDGTSATSTQINDAVKSSIDYGMRLILLVSSGLKAEQNSADSHPYGTVRIIATDQQQHAILYKKAKDNISPNDALPSMNHLARRAYKYRGHTLTNRALLANMQQRAEITNLEQMKRYKAVLLQRLKELTQPARGRTPRATEIQKIETAIMAKIAEAWHRASPPQKNRMPAPSLELLASKAFNRRETKEKIFDAFNQRFLRINRFKMSHILQSCVLQFEGINLNQPGFLALCLEQALNQYFDEIKVNL